MFKPLYETVVVIVTSMKHQTASGLYMPETRHKEKMREGRVVTCGPGRLLKDGTTHPCVVKPDDRIVFNEYMGTKATIGDTEYLFIKESDIWCVIEGDSIMHLKEEAVHED